jgi:hypothetical protein
LSIVVSIIFYKVALVIDAKVADDVVVVIVLVVAHIVLVVVCVTTITGDAKIALCV